jgi:ATPase family associated with various cellular activities (AAA)
MHTDIIMSKRGHLLAFPAENEERPGKKFKRIHATVDRLSNKIMSISEEINQIKHDMDGFDTSVFLDELEDIDQCTDPFYCNHDFYDPDHDMNIFDRMKPDIHMLICLGHCYHCSYRPEHRGIKLRMLKRLIPPLNELNKMVGMKDVKKAVVDHIIFTLEKTRTGNRCGTCIPCTMNLEVKCENENQDMMHTVITGPPGVGKTELGQILGKIYTAMGLLSKGTFHVAKRSDLIAKYLGQTAIKTKEFIEKCEGGVMFIDEAYSLGNAEGRDSFSKECIDTLNQHLTEKRDFLCIIAGYKDDLENCFFSRNKGLARRFSFRYDIPDYSPEELMQIFELKLEQEGWSVDEAVKLDTFFKKNKGSFPHFGGDVETLFFACRVAHNRRHFLSIDHPGKVLGKEDIKIGFDAFVENRKSKKEIDQIIFSMYT